MPFGLPNEDQRVFDQQAAGSGKPELRCGTLTTNRIAQKMPNTLLLATPGFAVLFFENHWSGAPESTGVRLQLV
jgi:hypothetical protein